MTSVCGDPTTGVNFDRALIGARARRAPCKSARTRQQRAAIIDCPRPFQALVSLHSICSSHALAAEGLFQPQRQDAVDDAQRLCSSVVVWRGWRRCRGREGGRVRRQESKGRCARPYEQRNKSSAIAQPRRRRPSRPFPCCALQPALLAPLGSSSPEQKRTANPPKQKAHPQRRRRRRPSRSSGSPAARTSRRRGCRSGARCLVCR